MNRISKFHYFHCEHLSMNHCRRTSVGEPVLVNHCWWTVGLNTGCYKQAPEDKAKNLWPKFPVCQKPMRRCLVQHSRQKIGLILTKTKTTKTVENTQRDASIKEKTIDLEDQFVCLGDRWQRWSDRGEWDTPENHLETLIGWPIERQGNKQRIGKKNQTGNIWEIALVFLMSECQTICKIKTWK